MSPPQKFNVILALLWGYQNQFGQCYKGKSHVLNTITVI